MPDTFVLFYGFSRLASEMFSALLFHKHHFDDMVRGDAVERIGIDHPDRCFVDKDICDTKPRKRYDLECPLLTIRYFHGAGRVNDTILRRRYAERKYL